MERKDYISSHNQLIMQVVYIKQYQRAKWSSCRSTLYSALRKKEDI
jgi:hypothetical protein